MGLLNRHRLWQVAVDALLIAVAWYATYEVGFQISRNPGWNAYWKQTILIVVVVKLVSLAAFGAYNKWWRYLSLPDIMALLRAIGIATIALLIVLSIVKFPRGVIIHPEASAGQKTQLAAPDCTPVVQGCVKQIKKDAIAGSLAPTPGTPASALQARARAGPRLHAHPAGRRPGARALDHRAPAPRIIRHAGQEGADRRRG